MKRIMTIRLVIAVKAASEDEIKKEEEEEKERTWST